MSSWKFVPEVTEVKVVEPAKYVFELTEAEAKGLYALLADGVGVQTRRRLGLSDLLVNLRGARTMKHWTTSMSEGSAWQFASTATTVQYRTTSMEEVDPW